MPPKFLLHQASKGEDGLLNGLSSAGVREFSASARDDR
jgi:hypothetical protein